MDCKDFICILIMYLLVELVKTRFTREHFTRRNNNLNMMLQDGDGNIQIMKVHHIYDAIEKAKQDAKQDLKNNEMKQLQNRIQNLESKMSTRERGLIVRKLVSGTGESKQAGSYYVCEDVKRNPGCNNGAGGTWANLGNCHAGHYVYC